MTQQEFITLSSRLDIIRASHERIKVAKLVNDEVAIEVAVDDHLGTDEDEI